MKKKAIKLNVASAFHSKLMQSAADEFIETAKTVEFKTANVDFYSNVLGTKLEDFSAMPDMLAKHIVSPVKFTSELAEMEKAGYENFIELGPNKVLTGLVKKTLKGKNAVNIENNATMEKGSCFSELKYRGEKNEKGYEKGFAVGIGGGNACLSECLWKMCVGDKDKRQGYTDTMHSGRYWRGI